ncbi:MAG: DedA family protein [Patescibacteria group bacterium]
MQFLKFLIDFILHIDVHLGELITTYGILTYAILFVIIFIETGLVFIPFLPGDSLLFAAGTFSAIGSLNPWLVFLLLSLAAVLGDTVNYWIGHFFGQKILNNPKIPINQEHVDKTNQFFAKHGGKTIFLARFVPIIRTFAPFVAGIGKMDYSKFIFYNIFGGIVWVGLFTFAGYFFGNVSFVKHNFSLVILAIIILSIVPMLLHFLQNLKKSPSTPGVE